MQEALTAAALLALVALGGYGLWGAGRSRRALGTPADQVTYRTLHTASLASPALRAGLTETSAEKAIKHLRTLLGARAVALTDGELCLAWDGAGQAHAPGVPGHARAAVEGGRTVVLGQESVACREPDCPVRHAVVAPLTTEEWAVGALYAYTVARP